MNAAVLSSGWIKGGAEGAREALAAYWGRVAQAAMFSPVQRTPIDRALGRWSLDSSPVFIGLELMARIFSPYDLNPRGYNPLTSILEESIDFERLAQSTIKLFITATNVRTGSRPHLSQRRDHTGRVARVGMPADDVSGRRDRWRGLLGRRLLGNPTITPLMRECDAQDTILVQINPASGRARREPPAKSSTA